MRVDNLVVAAVGAVLLVAFGLAGPAVATHGASIDDPWTRGEEDVLAVTSVLKPSDPCDEDAGPETGNGIVGKVWALPDGADGHWFGLTVQFPLHIDADWYRKAGDSCEPLGIDHADGRLGGETEVDEVPDGATHVIAWYREGSGDYLLEIPVEEPPGCDLSPFC